MTSFQEDLRATIASAMFNHSVNPSVATYLMRQFGAEGKPVTKEDVERKFGPEAAQAWQDARDAKARYFAAIRARGETPAPSDGAQKGKGDECETQRENAFDD